MSIPRSSNTLPKHDELSLLTRAIEVLSIVCASALVAAHLVHFAFTPELSAWWTPLAAFAGIILADFVSGLVHWTADTWGSETMPIVGRRFLRPFRVHHMNPDDFLRRNFVDTNGDVCMLVIPLLLAALLIPLDTGAGRLCAVVALGFCVGGMPTNQVHQWAHMRNPPRVVRWLQASGLLLSHAQHGRHHAAPYVTNYCIATGWCNRPLAAIGFFPALERLVSRVTGAKPRGDDHDFQFRTQLRRTER